QQLEPGSVLRMISTGGITGSRPDTAVLFADEVGMRQLFVASEPPGYARLLVQIFGKCFGQSICQCFGNDGAVIIMLMLERLRKFICAVNCDGEAAEIINRLWIAERGSRI